MENKRKSWMTIEVEVFTKRWRFYYMFIVIVCLACFVILFQQSSSITRIYKSITLLKIKYENRRASMIQCDSSLMHHMNPPFSGLAVEAKLPFLDRVHLYNEALHQLRLAHLRKTEYDKWENISSPDKMQVIGGAEDSFLHQLGNFTQIETLFLPWLPIHSNGKRWTSIDDSSNVLIKRYFQWTADEELCRWIVTPGETPAMYDVMFNRTCICDFEATLQPQSLPLLMLNAKPLKKEIYWPNNGKAYPSHFYSEPPAFAFYLHIIRNGVVNSYSEVWSGNMKVVHLGCSYRKTGIAPSNIDSIPLYDEVMAVSQYWGGGTFHRMIENIPRLSLYVEFLKRNPHIKVLAHARGQTAELLAIFGISRSRIVTGTCRAKLVYLPRSTMCGWANVQEIQVISMLYRKYIVENFKPEPRNKVVLIQRSGKRKFSEHAAIETMVTRITAEYNLSFSLFTDNPVPSLTETMKMFHSAVLVVAPHGAGLSNVIFSQPGTFVIESVCNPPFVNLCYLRLSNVLGHHWRGLHSQGGGRRPINVSIESLQDNIKKCISFLK